MRANFDAVLIRIWNLNTGARGGAYLPTLSNDRCEGARCHGNRVFGNEASIRDLHHQTRFVEWQEMGDILNLRRARKSAERRAAEQQAAANRLRHGRSRSERDLEATRKKKERRELDLRRIEKADEQ
jgi:hypothetical protein